MKGLKCSTYRKLFITLALLFIPCFFLLKNTNSASALSLNTDFLQGYTSTNSSPNTFTWSSYKYLWNSHDPNASPCGSSSCYIPNVYHMRGFQINYVDEQTQGNHASLHFELNIVFQSTNALNPGPASFFDLDQLYFGTTFIRYSNGSGTALSTEASSINTAVTRWVTNSGYSAQTLTVYGDITVSGVPSNTLGHFQITMYSPDIFAEILIPGEAITYFEQNPTSVIYANNLNDALLSQQIAQQEVANQLALQQQQQDQKDREDLQNTSDQADTDGSSSQQQAQATGTTLLKAFTDFVGALTSAQASNCVIDMDMGNLDLGNVDLCQLSLPSPLQALASIMLISFCVPLSIATGKKLIALFRSFQK